MMKFFTATKSYLYKVFDIKRKCLRYKKFFKYEIYPVVISTLKKNKVEGPSLLYFRTLL